MSSELKDLVGSNGSLDSQEESPHVGGGGGSSGKAKDERPLLKPGSAASEAANAATPSERLEELEKKYAPYVRKDAYGTMGRGELPPAEWVLLGIALVTLVPIRLVVGIFLVVLYYLICRLCTLFYAPNREDGKEDYAHMVGWRRVVVVRTGRFLSRIMLFVLGFYWIRESHRSFSFEDEHEQPDESERPEVIVSNHISYVDILYQMSSCFPSFVAKRSVARLPLIGIISKCLGCVYVQRESKSSKGVSGILTERIKEAHQNKLYPMMMLFPEGTTTNGNYLLPFKTGAFLAKAPVLPVILKYPYNRFSPAWDTISGVRHVFLLLCQFVNHLEVIHLPVYYPSEQEMEDPKLYANNVRKLMATEGNLILSDIGLAEKRIYHAALNGNSLPRVLHQKDD
ncbi:lysophospholipid acyltransferase LPEAT1-like isoform X1 [Phoenix dactylifera]|uniref:Lysophospholipid acyltransferase LPEAT1-like isoform X1 n=1 Tax=Phoenix dactylifera TaxID=42345 RepID=A0A8B8ZI34_PHODC|nr:lysophospholipid acyltransferase LPEAT1-like isoform X1 [Phoenix dactylifera]XP_038973825.1 lysophospholipid acyltransferase LPEAT1-like isoform X1 [Phoenix dactylifera]